MKNVFLFLFLLAGTHLSIDAVSKKKISVTDTRPETPCVDNVEDTVPVPKLLYKSARASFYGPGFHGRKTANGEIFNMNHLTAAHKSLPFGTLLKVTNLENNKSVIVRVNDRGPYVRGRELDLSLGAAKTIGIRGIGKVNIEILK